MQTNKAQPEAWEELFDQFHQKTEKFSGQIDRLHDDLGGAWTALKGHKQVLDSIQSTAAEIAQQAATVKTAWSNAHALATAAGNAASKNLSETSAAAVDGMVNQITDATDKAHAACDRWKSTTTVVRGWLILCITVSLLAGGLSAYFTYSLTHHTEPRERDEALQSKGVLLERMTKKARKEEKKMLDALILRTMTNVD
jgi:Tfp pilus assembly protein PilV